VIGSAPPKGRLDPLASPALIDRFAHLPAATSPELMAPLLQDALFAGSGEVVESCARPRAELSGSACALQYPLRVRDHSGSSRDVLVLGTLFATSGAAAAFAAETLAPLAEAAAARRTAVSRTFGVIDGLDLAASVFPLSAALPTLVRACDTTRMAEVMQGLFQRPVGVCDVELVAFRRTRGCVLRYRLDLADHPVVYGKIGYRARSGDVHGALHQLSRTVPRNRRAISYPQMLGDVAELELTLWGELKGVRPDPGDGPALDAMIVAATDVAAALHTSGVSSGDPRTLVDELGRAREAVDSMAPYAPELAQWLRECVDGVARDAASRESRQAALAHGDLTPSQLLLHDGAVSVLDFDKLCQAEPALDLGRFAAYLRFALAKRGRVEPRASADAFLGAYAAAGGRDVAPADVDLYARAYLVRMAARSWLQLKPARLGVALDALRHL